MTGSKQFVVLARQYGRVNWRGFNSHAEAIAAAEDKRATGWMCEVYSRVATVRPAEKEEPHAASAP